MADFSNDPFVEEMQTWTTLRCRCPHCKTVNYLNLDDMDDQTTPDIEVLECWDCSKQSWIMNKEEVEAYGYESMEDGFCEKGEKQP